MQRTDRMRRILQLEALAEKKAMRELRTREEQLTSLTERQGALESYMAEYQQRLVLKREMTAAELANLQQFVGDVRRATEQHKQTVTHQSERVREQHNDWQRQFRRAKSIDAMTETLAQRERTTLERVTDADVAEQVSQRSK